MASIIRVRDLPETAGPSISLYCPQCQAQYSASRGDYFMANPTTIMRCGDDDAPLRLVSVKTVIRAVRS